MVLKNTSYRCGFDRITDGSTSTMGLEESSRCKIETSSLVRIPNQGSLRAFARLSYSRSVPILVRSCCTNHSPDSIAIADRVGKTFDYYYPDPFSTSIAITAMIKAEAATLRRQKTHIGQSNCGVDSINQVTAADDSLG